MIVYAKKDGTVIWSDNNSTHKAGRVPLHEPLLVLGDNPSWYAIERPANLSLPVQPEYPDYWVKKSDTLLELPGDVPGPAPVVGPGETLVVTDEGAAVAIVTLLKWLKQ